MWGTQVNLPASLGILPAILAQLCWEGSTFLWLPTCLQSQGRQKGCIRFAPRSLCCPLPSTCQGRGQGWFPALC